MSNRRKAMIRLGAAIAAALMGLLAVATTEASPVASPPANVAEAAGWQPPITPTATISSQPPITPTVTAQDDELAQFQITFSELGYGERTLSSPASNVQYTLRLPEDWRLLEGSYLDLDFSYAYTQIESLPPFFGELSIVVDEQTQYILPIEEPLLEHTHLRVPLPPDLMNAPPNNVHTVQLLLDAGYLCEVPHKAQLIAHSTSFLFLNYQQVPLTVDLADYPRPFYQRAFEPDTIRFALATEPTSTELAGALAIAARLGDLTNNRLIISTTTDLEWLDRLEAGDPLGEHLVIVGRPETQRLLFALNEMEALHVSFRQRQMGLTSQGPTVVAPGNLFTYTLTVTNTAQRTVSDLLLVDRLPRQAQFVSCEPACTVEREESSQVRWLLNRLSPRKTARFTLVLSSTGILDNLVTENTATLLNGEGEPVNVDTLTTTLSPSSTQTNLRSSVRDKSNYFFVWNGQAMAEGDGIVQEIISPWDSNRAILIVAGLNDQAVYKASQALSSATEFPGMSGPVALVSQVRAPAPSPTELLVTDLTFADLGYGNRTISGGSGQSIGYTFFLPASWRLTDDSYVELSFRHSQLIDYEASSLTVLLNNELLASIPLTEESTHKGTLRVKLLASTAAPGQNNRLALRVDLSPLDVCSGNSADLWLTVSRDSYLHLDHQEQDRQRLNLDHYPYPFNADPYLSDVLITLPAGFRPADWQMALRLAAALGNAAGGSALAPMVTLDHPEAVDALSDYHVIALGRPSANPWIERVNAQLPQPFRPGFDEIEQRIDDVVFRLPPGLSLGFIQLIPSPWNEARAFLAITGTNDESVEEALDVLIYQLWTLDGDLALVRDGEVNTIDTRGLTTYGMATAVATVVPEMAPVVTATTALTQSAPGPMPMIPGPTPGISGSPGPTRASRPRWLMPLVGVNGLMIIAILAVAFWRARRRR
jgi:uncharacterized repeat protein (TIGR01451 family)